MATDQGGSETSSTFFTRRGALTALSVGALATAAARTSEAAQQYASRVYEGESTAGNLQEALDAALQQVSADLGAGGVADAMANWRLSDITGQRGGIAGFHNVKVRLVASRTPPYPRKG